MSRLAQGRPPRQLDHVGLLPTGVAVKKWPRNVPALPELVDDVVLVDTDECARRSGRVRGHARRARARGALGVAVPGVGRASRVARQTLVAVALGREHQLDRLRFIAEEAELGEHREAVLASPSRAPGQLQEILRHRWRQATSRFIRSRLARRAIFVGIEVDGRGHDHTHRDEFEKQG